MKPRFISGTVYLCLLHLATAQEKPSLNIVPQYSFNVTYRQNVCNRHDGYDNGSFELRDALEGFELRPLIVIGGYFQLDENGAINEEDPGLVVGILDELAKRGSFTWRNSFAVTEGPGEDHTWNDLLAWGTESYDINADWWVSTIERLRVGIGFPEGFVDASFILVGTKKDHEHESSKKADFWTWLEPFDHYLWIAIAVTVLISGALYEIVERNDPARDAKSRMWVPGKGLYSSCLAFMQHFELSPGTREGKILAISMAFWSLIITATYTASLASLFVIQTTPSIQIQTVDDAINAGMSMCIWKDGASHAFMLKNYPKGIYVPIPTLGAGHFEGLLDRRCDLVVATIVQWEQVEIDKTINKDCNLERIGRVINFQGAGFGVKADSGRLCTNLVEDVLNLHLVDMNTDGTMDLLKKKDKQKTRDIDCEAINAAADDDVTSNRQLSFKEMAGPFVVHSFLTGMALVLATVSVFVQHSKRKDPERKSDDHSKRVLAMNADDHEDSTNEEENGRLSMQALARSLSGVQKAQKEQGKKQDETAGEHSAQLAYIGAVLKRMQEKEASSEETLQ
jgi:hypothetical protein